MPGVLLRLGGMLASAAVVGAATIYSVADCRRIPLDEPARDALVAEGKAQSFVQTSKGFMHVRTAGPHDGPVVVLVHGGVVGGQAFTNWIEPLTEEGYRVVVPDLLGYGYSARPDVPYTREFYLGQLHSLIDGLGIDEPVHLAGGSFGGIVVTEFAAENPRRVASVALMSPAGLGRSNVVDPGLLTPVIGDWVFRVVGADLATRQIASAYAGSPGQRAMLDWMAEQSKYRGFAEGMLNSLRHYDFQWRPEAFQALGRAGVPVFAAWGTDDTVHPYERTQLLHRYVPQTQLLTLDGAGHAITYGRAEDVIDGYNRFLRDGAR